MASLQDIRRRIKSVTSIQQITSAMNMVATSRLRRAKEKAVKNRPYADKVRQVVSDVAAGAADFSNPLLEVHDTGKDIFLIVAADKGLAGAYSSNVFKEAARQMGEKSNTRLVLAGQKGVEHYHARDFDIASTYTGFSDKPTYEHAKKLAQDVTQRFISGEAKSVRMVYTKFISALTCTPETIQLLPFETLSAESNGPRDEYIFEPSAAEVLGFLLPMYLETTVYAALLQSAASELSSRMNAMSSATDNAEELIADMNLYYNKVRQANITREITEIVGGAEALK